MSETCNCESTTLGNMGVPGCTPIAKIASKLILTNYFQSDGTITKIDLSDTLDATYFAERMQQYDSGVLVPLDERWYISPFLENVEDIREETVFQTFNSGKKAKVRQGTRSFTGHIIEGAAYEMLQKVKRFQCATLGAFIIDTAGNIIGNGDESGFLKPIRIDKASFDVQLVKATDAEAQMVRITFDWARLEQDSSLKMITASDIVADVLSLEGLIDVFVSFSNITTGGFTARFATSYGSAKNPVPVSGLVVGDFSLAEVSPTPGAVSITSVTESATVPGTYTFVTATTAQNDVLQLTLNKAGLDSLSVLGTSITIP